MRDYSYDYLRAYSALMIVCCHIFRGFGISSELAHYLGGTYVDVFLLLSAFLLGKAYNERIYNDPKMFLKKRFSRLIPSYFLFLGIAFSLIIIFIGFQNISLIQIFGHFLFLNWFIEPTRVFLYPLPQLGHLWFMNAIVLGYLLITLISLLIKRYSQIDSKKIWITFFVISSLFATVITYKLIIFVYPCTILIGFTLLFFKGEIIVKYIQNVFKHYLVPVLIICNLGGVIYYMAGGYTYPALMFWINFINAFLWIAASPRIFKQHEIPKAVAFISFISFEIYLIHHPFCLGTFSLIKYMPLSMAIITVLLISVLGGYCLNKLSNYTIKLFKYYEGFLTKNHLA